MLLRCSRTNLSKRAHTPAPSLLRKSPSRLTSTSSVEATTRTCPPRRRHACRSSRDRVRFRRTNTLAAKRRKKTTMRRVGITTFPTSNHLQRRITAASWKILMCNRESKSSAQVHSKYVHLLTALSISRRPQPQRLVVRYFNLHYLHVEEF